MNRIAIAALAVSGIAWAASGPAQAAARPSATTGCTSVSASTTSSQDRTQTLSDYIAGLHAAGDSDAQVTAALASKYCLVRVDTGPAGVALGGRGVHPDSVNTAVHSRPPTISYDSQAKEYYAFSYWDWTDTSYFGDAHQCLNCVKTIGGPDGFATAFNSAVTMLGYSITYQGALAGCHFGIGSSRTPSNADTYGAGFTFQDTDYYGASCNDMTAIHGTEIIDFRASGGCKSIYGFSQYAHSWNSTSANGFSVGPYSLGVYWSSTSNEWTSSSQPGATARVC